MPHGSRLVRRQPKFSGCPVGHLKEILGHERLETTCRYAPGLDRRAAKQAHQKCLVYERQEIPERIGPSVVLDALVASSGASEFITDTI